MTPELYHHVKTGGVYKVICNAQDESQPDRVMVIYQNTATGDRWVRPASEFNDGRFVRLPATRRAAPPEPAHTGLTFGALRAANRERLPLFRNRHGAIAHSQPDGSDWTPAQWLQAVVGELGEYANIRKKFERGDLTADEYEHLARKELADVQVYLDILAMRCLDAADWPHATGVNLGAATVDKFNEVSERVGCDVRL